MNNVILFSSLFWVLCFLSGLLSLIDWKKHWKNKKLIVLWLAILTGSITSFSAGMFGYQIDSTILSIIPALLGSFLFAFVFVYAGIDIGGTGVITGVSISCLIFIGFVSQHWYPLIIGIILTTIGVITANYLQKLSFCRQYTGFFIIEKANIFPIVN